MTSPVLAETASYYAPPAAPSAGRSRRLAALLAVLGVHLLVAGLIAVAVVRPELAPPLRTLAVRLLEA
ncbi:MAG: hypothetical protein HYU78_05560, partial [Rhodocyclales bacterium]|nr:hypothetical protein [Rhodocyclales bacterium]